MTSDPQALESPEGRIRALQKASVLFLSAQTEDELAQALVDSAREAFAAVNSAVLFMNEDGGVRVAAGGEFEQILLELVAARSPDEQPSGRDFVAVSDIDDSPEISDVAREILRKAKVRSLTAVALSDEEGIRGAFICLFRQPRQFDAGTVELHQALARQSALVLSRIRLQRQLESMALYDRLTGLANRNLISQHVTQVMESMERTHRPLGLLFVDLDGFKAINDQLGHRIGDEVLQAVAGRISDTVRAMDLPGRFGGDEFLIVCESISLDDAQAVAERVRGAVAVPLPGVPAALAISASVGVMHFSPNPDAVAPSPDALVREADAAMYEAKRLGGNRIVTHRL